MSDTPRLFGATGQPIDAAAKAEGRVQPAPSATPSGPKNRYRSFVVMMPNNIAANIIEEHKHIASFGRAPESFGDYLMVLMMQGRQVFVPHQLAEIEAESQERMAADFKWAQDVLAAGDESEKYSADDRKRAHDIMAAIEAARAQVEQAEADAAAQAGVAQAGAAAPTVEERPSAPSPATPSLATATTDAEGKALPKELVDIHAEAARSRAEAARGKLSLEEALRESDAKLAEFEAQKAREGQS